MEEFTCNYDPQDLEPIIDSLVEVKELLITQNQVLTDTYHLGIWIIGACAGVFILIIIYSLFQKFAR